jgi:hypothetical protein
MEAKPNATQLQAIESLEAELKTQEVILDKVRKRFSGATVY